MWKIYILVFSKIESNWKKLSTKYFHAWEREEIVWFLQIMNGYYTWLSRRNCSVRILQIINGIYTWLSRNGPRRNGRATDESEASVEKIQQGRKPYMPVTFSYICIWFFFFIHMYIVYFYVCIFCAIFFSLFLPLNRITICIDILSRFYRQIYSWN